MPIVAPVATNSQPANGARVRLCLLAVARHLLLHLRLAVVRLLGEPQDGLAILRKELTDG